MSEEINPGNYSRTTTEKYVYSTKDSNRKHFNFKINRSILLHFLTISVLILLVIALSGVLLRQIDLKYHVFQKTTNNSLTVLKPIIKAGSEQNTFIFASCPVDQNQCQNNNEIQANDQRNQPIYGLEYKKLKPKTNILAVISGNLKIQKITKNNQKFIQLEIDSTAMNTAAIYLIPINNFTFLATGSSVMEKDIIGVINTDLSSPSALLLNFNSLKQNIPIQLKPEKDGLYSTY
jgi:hypothetical protein